jgi:hypothetical protein
MSAAGPFRAGCVASKLVLVAGPGPIGDLTLTLRVDEHGELGRRAADALAKI